MVVAWLYVVLAAVDTSVATSSVAAGGAVFFALAALLFMGGEMIKAVKK